MTADDSRRLTFVLCTEAGWLERQSVLLAASIRAFGGALSRATIHSFCPRAGRPLAPLTRARLHALCVAHEDVELNTEFRDYPFANKVLVASYAERRVESEIIVFMDSDQVILNEPLALLLDSGAAAALRPVHTQNVGSDGAGDVNHPYWRDLYRLLGVTRIGYVCTTVDGKRILAYWNAGLVAVRRSVGIFTAWEHNFRCVAARGLVPASGRFFQEQSVLAATLSALGVAVDTLPHRYNYSLAHHELLPAAERAVSISEVVTLHYHKVFERPRAQHPLDALGLAQADQRSIWLRTQLAQTGVYLAGR